MDFGNYMLMLCTCNFHLGFDVFRSTKKKKKTLYKFVDKEDKTNREDVPGEQLSGAPDNRGIVCRTEHTAENHL